MTRTMYPYGLVGNCQIAAHIHLSGSIDWLCMPRPDGSPVFGKLLDPDGGSFEVLLPNDAISSQHYITNTNVLVTTVECAVGSFTITDFCPRFEQYGRTFRPVSVFRILTPVRGNVPIRIRCRPVSGWDKRKVHAVQGSNHARYELEEGSLHVTTNMSITVLMEEHEFILREKTYFALTWNTGLSDDLPGVSEQFLTRTVNWWRWWVQHCSIPSSHQKETIRSALVLKLHCFEDTGAILAALTTSLPEEIGGTRNWDYRFCWLRDAYFVLSAFHRLGHFDEMEAFLRYLLDIAHQDKPLHPVYRLDRSLPLPEIIHDRWKGYYGSGPVRSGNQAAEHIQNDVYGEMILTLAPIFLDERFHHLRTKDVEGLLKKLAHDCARSISQKDAGPWELRTNWQEHSFPNLLCWAGLDRIDRIVKAGYLPQLTLPLADELSRAATALERATVAGSIRNGPTDPTFDSGLLLLPLVNYPHRDVSERTVRGVQASLQLGTSPEEAPFLFRYKKADDFGTPQSAFMICSFWLIRALGLLGHVEEAERLMRGVERSANHLALYAEHFDPYRNEQLGNFPQAYSHVGQINAAFVVSPPWDDVL